MTSYLEVNTYLLGGMSGTLVLIVAKSVLADRGIVLVGMAWSLQLQLDEGGENL